MELCPFLSRKPPGFRQGGEDFQQDMMQRLQEIHNAVTGNVWLKDLFFYWVFMFVCLLMGMGF